MVTTEYSLRATMERRDDETDAGGLNLRIALVTAIVVVELWALTAALDAWAGQRPAELFPLISVQAAAFLAALAIWITTPRPGAALSEPIPNKA